MPEILVVFVNTPEDYAAARSRYKKQYGKPFFEERFNNDAIHQKFQNGGDHFCFQDISGAGIVLIFKKDTP